jgi:dTDP-4-dehydrorhamnose reductase
MTQQLPHWGTYHYCNAPAVSWYQFAYHIIEIAKKHQSCNVEKIIAIKTSEYPTPANRPPYSVLDCNKLLQEMGIKQAMWDKSLEMIIPQLITGNRI